jgi:hypothetical protein
VILSCRIYGMVSRAPGPCVAKTVSTTRLRLAPRTKTEILLEQTALALAPSTRPLMI